MLERSGSPAGETTGIPTLDALLDGGLVAGDNVLWIADEHDLVRSCCVAFANAAPRETTWIAFRPPPDDLDPEVSVRSLAPDAVAVAVEPVVSAIAETVSERNRLVVDGFGSVLALAGADLAVDFYRRCCPRLFDLAAVACWSIDRGALGTTVVSRISRVAQCVLELRPDTIRVVKAEGRPARVQGALAELHRTGTDRAPVVGRDLVAGRLGEGLKRLRKQRNLTQRQLASLAAVTPAAISQAESGRRGLSLETLLPLCDQLGIGLDELLGTHQVAGHSLARRDQRATGQGLTTLFDAPKGGSVVYRVELDPGTTGRPPFRHKGSELVLVSRGLVLVDLGDDTPVIRAGDGLRVTADPIEGWTNLGASAAELFWLAEPPGA